MAHKISKDMTFQIDNAGTLAAITGSVNSASLQGVQEILDDSGLGDDERTKINGLAGATLPLNGWVDSTTDAIFGPLVGNRTSIARTFCYYNGIKYYTGEAVVENPTFSGNVGELQTWSCNLILTGSLTRTSVDPGA